MSEYCYAVCDKEISGHVPIIIFRQKYRAKWFIEKRDNLVIKRYRFGHLEQGGK